MRHRFVTKVYGARFGDLMFPSELFKFFFKVLEGVTPLSCVVATSTENWVPFYNICVSISDRKFDLMTNVSLL